MYNPDSNILSLYKTIHTISLGSKFSSVVCFFLSLSATNNIIPDLANSQENQENEQSNSNIKLVASLYEALKNRELNVAQQILDSDIEWWFHGPPCHQQHLMRLLTGAANPFLFSPKSVTAIGPFVLAEGFDLENRSVSWVHAWTVNNNGVITQVREYFNTSLTVASFGNCSSSSKSKSKSALRQSICWESKLSGQSVPGLVLAI